MSEEKEQQPKIYKLEVDVTNISLIANSLDNSIKIIASDMINQSAGRILRQNMEKLTKINELFKYLEKIIEETEKPIEEPDVSA